jgi:hypothetical protein
VPSFSYHHIYAVCTILIIILIISKQIKVDLAKTRELLRAAVNRTNFIEIPSYERILQSSHGEETVRSNETEEEKEVIFQGPDLKPVYFQPKTTTDEKITLPDFDSLD